LQQNKTTLDLFETKKVSTNMLMWGLISTIVLDCCD